MEILLAEIQQTGVSSEEFWNKEVHDERVRLSMKKYLVVKSFQRTSLEDWGSSNKRNKFSKIKTFEQCNYGDGQKVILSSIKKGIISYEKTAR